MPNTIYTTITPLLTNTDTVVVTVPGPQGPKGDDGIIGVDGADGAQGPQGVPGDPGGPAGPAGPAGADGAQGIQGPIGPEGPAGADGIIGVDGEAGPQGIQGETGETGPQGIQGETGEAGPQGIPGTNGTDGDTGIQGEAGPQGIPGTNGTDGIQGIQGIQGETGEAGPQGDTGIQGETGEQGIPGSGGGGTNLFPNKAAGEPIVIIAMGNSDIISQQEATVFMANNSKRLSWVVDTQSWETIDMSSTDTAVGWVPGDFFVGYTGGQHGNLPLSTGDYLSKMFDVDCYVIQAGRGGTPLSLYAPNGAYETEFSAEIDTALALIPGSPTKADIFVFGHHAGAADYNVAEYSETFLRLYNFWKDTRGYIDLETTQVLLPDMYENRTSTHGNIDDWRASAQTSSQTNGNVKSVSSRGLGSSDGIHISGNDLTPYGARVAQAALEAHFPQVAIPAGAPRRVMNTIPMTGTWILDANSDTAPASGHFGFKLDGGTLQMSKTDNASAVAPLEWVKFGDILSFTDTSLVTATMTVYLITEFDDHWEFQTITVGTLDALTVTQVCSLDGDTQIPSGNHDDFLVAPRGGRVITGEVDTLAIPVSPFAATDYKKITYVPGFSTLALLGAEYTYTNDIGIGAVSFERAFFDYGAFNIGAYTYERHSHNYVTEVGKGIKVSDPGKGRHAMNIAYDESAAPQPVYTAQTTSATGSTFRVGSLKYGEPMDEGRSNGARVVVSTNDGGSLQPMKTEEFISYSDDLTTTMGTTGQTLFSGAINNREIVGSRPALIRFDAKGYRNDGGSSIGEFYACTKQAIVNWTGTDPVLSNVSTISEVFTTGVTAEVVFGIDPVLNKYEINVNPHTAEEWVWSCVIYKEVFPVSHSG